MTRIEETMVETYYLLIINGRRTNVPENVPTVVRGAVAERLESDKNDKMKESDATKS